jgi:hypothetical protein
MENIAAVLLLFTLTSMRTSASGSLAQSCAPIVNGVRFICPPGWEIVDKDHPRPKTVLIGNFTRNPDKNLSSVIPVGKSTISIDPKPDLYRNIDDWISATEHMSHMVPDSKETTETFFNKSQGRISARCFTSSPTRQRPGDRTCLFTISNVPLMLDLFISPKATNVLELEGYVSQMIEAADVPSK